MNLTAIFIVFICVMGLVEIIKQVKKRPKVDTSATQALESQVKELRERVKVLEKIVTDENYDLKRQFESLDD